MKPLISLTDIFLYSFGNIDYIIIYSKTQKWKRNDLIEKK